MFEQMKELEIARARTPVTDHATSTADDQPDIRPPSFPVPLKDASINEGSKFTFMCRVQGAPEPHVYWLKDGVKIENNPDYKVSLRRHGEI